MLVLTRKVGEKIMIDGGIEITILAVQHQNRVKVGIVAPRTTSIMRDEILRRIEKEGRHER